MKVCSFALFVLLFFCISCDNEEITYADCKIVFEGDTTTFKNIGEKRTFTISALKQKYADGIATDQWVPVSESGISVTIKSDEFKLTSSSAALFDISVEENQADTLVQASLLVSVLDGAVTKTEEIALKQSASEISYAYKIESEQNPFIIPKEGGEFFIPFTCQCKRTVNGKEKDWEYSDMKRLRYVAYVNSGLVRDAKGEQVRSHRFEAESTDKPGHYNLHIIAAGPFYLGENTNFEMYYTIRNQIFEGEEEIYLYQTFSQEQDPTIEASFPLPVSNSGPLNI